MNIFLSKAGFRCLVLDARKEKFEDEHDCILKQSFRKPYTPSFSHYYFHSLRRSGFNLNNKQLFLEGLNVSFFMISGVHIFKTPMLQS